MKVYVRYYMCRKSVYLSVFSYNAFNLFGLLVCASGNQSY